MDSVTVGDVLEPEHDVLGAEEAQRAALEYIRRGWAVTAGPGLDMYGVCGCRAGKRCRNPGKHAHAGWGNEERRTLTSDQAERYWSPSNAEWKKKPVDQVFIVPYLSGLIVADVDIQETWNELEVEKPDTLMVRSGSGRGGHYLYKFEWDLSQENPPVVAGKLPGGCGEIKFRGIIAAPPSLHKSGGRYIWDGWTKEIANAPDWMTAEPTNRVEAIRSWDTIVDADPTNEWIYLQFKADCGGIESFAKVKTSRPLALFATAAGMAKWIAAGRITEDEVIERLLAASKLNDTLDDYGEVELIRQIRNGIQAGMIEKRT